MSFKIRDKRFGKNDPHCKKVAVIQGGDMDKKCLYLCDDESGDTEIKQSHTWLNLSRIFHSLLILKIIKYFL